MELHCSRWYHNGYPHGLVSLEIIFQKRRGTRLQCWFQQVKSHALTTRSAVRGLRRVPAWCRPSVPASGQPAACRPPVRGPQAGEPRWPRGAATLRPPRPRHHPPRSITLRVLNTCRAIQHAPKGIDAAFASNCWLQKAPLNISKLTNYEKWGWELGWRQRNKEPCYQQCFLLLFLDIMWMCVCIIMSKWPNLQFVISFLLIVHTVCSCSLRRCLITE